MAGQFISTIKDSAIVSVIGLHDLMYNADTIRGITFNPFGPLIVVAVIYFIMTFGLSNVMGVFERRLRVSD